VIDTFEQLFLTVTSRIVAKEESDQIVKREGMSAMPKLQRAKSIIDTDSSSLLLGQAFEIIFKEFERYIDIMMSYEGIDGDTFVRKRNEDRYQHGDDNLPELKNEDGLLLDEVEDVIEDKEEEKNDEEAEKAKAAEEAEKAKAAEEAEKKEAEDKPAE